MEKKKKKKKKKKTPCHVDPRGPPHKVDDTNLAFRLVDCSRGPREGIQVQIRLALDVLVILVVACKGSHSSSVFSRRREETSVQTDSSLFFF